MVKLGDMAKDVVTGFEGIVTGKTEFLNGCTRVGLQAKTDKEGKVPEVNWFDEPQLKTTKKAAVKCGPRDVGGPTVSTPKRQSDCKR